jgi:hypothetical protein
MRTLLSKYLVPGPGSYLSGGLEIILEFVGIVPPGDDLGNNELLVRLAICLAVFLGRGNMCDCVLVCGWGERS